MVIVTCVWKALQCSRQQAWAFLQDTKWQQIAVITCGWTNIMQAIQPIQLREGAKARGKKTEKKKATLKHNNRGENFVQQGFMIAGWMMYSNGKVQ